MPTIADAARVAELLRGADSVLLASHVNPDGDTLGAALAVYNVLKSQGKNVVCYNETGIPYNLGFLPGAADVSGTLPERVDLTVTFDNGSVSRFGEEFERRARAGELGTVAVVDHHITPIDFGDLHYVDFARASCGELAFEIAWELLGGRGAAALPYDVALCVYTAIVVDTGGFRYSNTDVPAMRAAAECLGAGINAWDVTLALYENQPLARVRIFSEAMQTLELSRCGRFAHLTVTQDMLDRTGATPDMLDGLINQPRSIEGVEVSAVFKPRGPTKWGLSFRSKGTVDVADIAQGFGGGGHKNAAGATLTGSLDEIKARVTERVAFEIARHFACSAGECAAHAGT